MPKVLVEMELTNRQMELITSCAIERVVVTTMRCLEDYCTFRNHDGDADNNLSDWHGSKEIVVRMWRDVQNGIFLHGQKG